MVFKAPSPPYLGPAKFHGSKTNLPLKRIVVHGTVSPTVPGGARGTAGYFKSQVTRPSSAHYVVDPGEVVQCVYDSIVAYHAPPNEGSIGIELCDMVGDRNNRPLPMSRWDDPAHTAMLARAAHLVAELCLAYDVPVRRVTRVGLRLGRKGICGHYDVSKAWGQTSHWDPGEFPWRRFIGLVQADAAELRGNSRTPPIGETRVTRFRSGTEALLVKYLDPAARSGREQVAEVAADIRAALAKLPPR